jgi:phosphatidate cytidylyltransferase
MKLRLVTAALGLVVFVPLLFFSNAQIFRIAFAIISAASAFELLQCAGVLKKYLLSVPLILFAAAMPLLAGLSDGVRYSVLIFVLMYCLSTLVFSGGKISAGEAGVSFMAVVFFAISYTCTVLLRETSVFMAIFVFLGAWISDTFAYLTGRAVGKTPLIPKISPKKTVEGAIGGAVADMVMYPVFGLILSVFFDVSVNYLSLALLGIFASLVSQLGDLILSAVKRSYDVKDFGNIFPGHGGVLDRFDSPMLAAPAICLINAIIALF